MRNSDDMIQRDNGLEILDDRTVSDELHSDFGWNTYKAQRDGSRDLIAIKSEQYLVNSWDGKAGNNPYREKSASLEGLNNNDQIKIVASPLKASASRNV